MEMVEYTSMYVCLLGYDISISFPILIRTKRSVRRLLYWYRFCNSKGLNHLNNLITSICANICAQSVPIFITILICNRFRGAHGMSGFGFELTFRLKKEPGKTAPPPWPAELMQELAKYVFRSSKCHGPFLYD